MSSKIVVFGSCSVDYTTYGPRLPSPGETLHGYKFTTSYGGKGANQCVAAAKLGGDVAMVARVGDDERGRDYMKHLINLGVDTTHIRTAEEKGTGIAQINVSVSGENQIVIVSGANKELSEEDALLAKKYISEAAVLVGQLETPSKGTLAAFRLCKGMRILNAAPALPEINSELLSLTTVLCVNESEAAIMTGKPVETLSEVYDAILELLKCGCETVVITLGGNGAAFATKDEKTPVHVKSDKVEAVDTTGAGDAFVGTLAVLLASGQNIPLKEAVSMSCYAASRSVTKEGTQTSFLEMAYKDLIKSNC